MITEPNMTPQNQRNGMWVQIWIPLSDNTTAATTEHSTTSNMLSQETSFPSSWNASPDFSNSPMSFIPSPYGSSSESALESSLAIDHLPNNSPLFPPPLDMPLDGGSDWNPQLDIMSSISVGEDMGHPAPSTTSAEHGLFDEFVDWNLLDVPGTSPSTTTFDSFSPSTSSSHTPAVPSRPTPTFLSNPPSLPPLQPLSPPPARPSMPTTYRCQTCSKAYSKHCDLTRHKRKHTKPHRCKICDFRSAELRGLQRHMWAKHREVAEQTGVPKQIARCDHPGCSYEARLDNVMRHMKRHEKAKAKRAARR